MDDVVITPEQIGSRLDTVRERIAVAAARAGRLPQMVRLMAVSKTHPGGFVEVARRAGISLFGENRVQEADAKRDAFAGAELHLIGHLQRNKARQVPGLFSCVQSIDALRTAQALSAAVTGAHASAPADRSSASLQESPADLDVLLELNSSAEDSKFGVSEDAELLELADQIAELPYLRVAGLMTIGPHTNETSRIATAFARTRALHQRLIERHRGAETLSMGMSADYEIAVEHGATLVRLGSVLFGERSG